MQRKPGREKTQEEDLLHFSLQGILSDECNLAINKLAGILSLMRCSEGERPRLIEQQSFTLSEMLILLPLLEAYPYYCPYSVLYASFHYSQTSEKAVKRAEDHLSIAADEGVWDSEMRALRNTISRARLKFRPFGVEIHSILETGYILMFYQPREAEG